jgi:hypothetical protein
LAAASIPAEFAQDASVTWILSFQKKPSSDFDGGEAQVSDDPARDIGAMVCRDMMSQLRPLVSSYFASLMHIGRMRTVSEFAVQRINRLEDEQNFEASILNLREALGAQNSAISFPADILKRACHAARRAQQQQKDIAGQWFARWRQEVDPLREAFRLLEDAWNYVQTRGREREYDLSRRLVRAVLVFSNATSRAGLLRQEMENAGVKFKREAGEDDGGKVPTPVRGSLTPMLIGALAGGQDREFWHFEWRHFWYDLLTHEYSAPLIEQLRLKYFEGDPFVAYTAGGRPADKQLIAIIQENMLWNNHESPWLDAWRRGLPTIPSGSEWIGLADFSLDAESGWFEHADSAIKTALLHKRPAPGESWDRFIQHHFEDFVRSIASTVREWMQSSASDGRRYSADELYTVFSGVTLRLNELGYRLDAPAISLIRGALGEDRENDRDQGTATL